MRRKTPRRRPTQGRSRRTVDAIIEGLAQVVVREGWPATTTAKIAQRSGVSVGTLYQYYDDRDAVLDALLERIVEEQLAVFVGVTEDVARLRPDRDEAIARVLDGVLESVKIRPELLRRLILDVPSQRFTELDRTWKTRCVQVVQAALYAGDTLENRSVDVVATVMVGAIFGVVRDVVCLRPELLRSQALREELHRLIHHYL